MGGRHLEACDSTATKPVLEVCPSTESQNCRDFPKSASMEELGGKKEGGTELQNRVSCEETPEEKTPNYRAPPAALPQSLEVLSHLVPSTLGH